MQHSEVSQRVCVFFNEATKCISAAAWCCWLGKRHWSRKLWDRVKCASAGKRRASEFNLLGRIQHKSAGTQPNTQQPVQHSTEHARWDFKPGAHKRFPATTWKQLGVIPAVLLLNQCQQNWSSGHSHTAGQVASFIVWSLHDVPRSQRATNQLIYLTLYWRTTLDLPGWQNCMTLSFYIHLWFKTPSYLKTWTKWDQMQTVAHHPFSNVQTALRHTDVENI